jgi:hypothetical protein
MQYEYFNIEEPSYVHERVLRRMYATIYTLNRIHEELLDPIDPDRRADILLAAEDITIIALALASRARAIAWQQDDPYDIHSALDTRNE